MTNPDFTDDDDDDGIPDPELPMYAVRTAMREFLEAATEGQNLPRGLESRPRHDLGLIEILSHGRVIATINRDALLERAGVIARSRN
jgi:hypothetical protein